MKQPDLQEGHSQWVIVRCQNGYERAVQRELLARIEENAMHSTIREVIHPSDANPLAMVGLPSERGRKYPGYLLVRMMVSESALIVLRNTPGVTEVTPVD